MNCPTCDAPISEKDNQCRKCGVLLVKWGTPAAEAPASPVAPSSNFGFVGFLGVAVVVGYGAYVLFWPKAEDVRPHPVALHKPKAPSVTKMLESFRASLTDAKATTAKAEAHTDAMVKELESSGVVAEGEVGKEAATLISTDTTNGGKASSARDLTNAQTAKQLEELSVIDGAPPAGQAKP